MIYDADRPTLTLGTITTDGEGVAFRIERGDGVSLDVVCTFDDISDIFHYLASLAKAAGADRDTPVPEPTKTYNDLTPIPAEELNFQPVPDTEETMIVMRLTGFDMAFALPNGRLARLAADIARIAATLSADQSRRN